METTFGLYIGIIALIASFIIQARGIVQLLITVAIIGLSCDIFKGFEEDSSLLMIHYSLIAILVLASLVSFIPKKLIIYSGPILSLLALIPIGAKVTFFGFEIVWTPVIALLPFFGSLIPVIAHGCAPLIKKITDVGEAQFKVAFSLFGAALLIWFSMFQASLFGVVLLGFGWYASGITMKSNQVLNGGVAFFLLATAFFITKMDEQVADSMLRGNLFMGFVAGIGLVGWNLAFSTASRFRWFLSTFLPLVLVIGFVLFGVANANFGGMTTFVGVLIGAAFGLLGNFWNSKTDHKHASFVAPLIFVGATGFLSTMLKVEKLNTKTLIETPVVAKGEEKPDPLSIPAIELDQSITGTWKSIQANSKVTFELGPDGGKTEGAFKEFKVSVNFDKSGNPSKINVDLPAGKLTTFNDLRDESVLGEGYINAPKFPKVSYSSTAITKSNDRFIVKGELVFLGQKQAVDLELKFVSKGIENEKPFVVMIGKSVVDRTKHGMKSDAKIGDLVHVAFEIALQK